MPRRFLVARFLISVACGPGLSVTSLRPYFLLIQSNFFLPRSLGKHSSCMWKETWALSFLTLPGPEDCDCGHPPLQLLLHFVKEVCETAKVEWSFSWEPRG